MIPAVIALGSLAAAGMSDSDRKRLAARIAMGNFKEAFLELGPVAFAKIVQRLPPGSDRDTAARLWRNTYWLDDNEYPGKRHALEDAKNFVLEWSGKWIPIIGGRGEGNWGHVYAYGTPFRKDGRKADKVVAMTFPHATMVRLGKGAIDDLWDEDTYKTVFPVEEIQGGVPAQTRYEPPHRFREESEFDWRDIQVYSKAFSYPSLLK